MIRPEDWRLIGLPVPGAARFGVPTAPAAAPMRAQTELFPDWAAQPPPERPRTVPRVMTIC